MNSSTEHLEIESDLNIQHMKNYEFDKPIKVSIKIEDEENEDYHTGPFQESAQTSYINSNILREQTDVPVQKTAKTSFTNNVLGGLNNGSLEKTSHTVYTQRNVPCQQDEVLLQKYQQIPYTDNNLLEQNNVPFENNVRGIQNDVPSQRTAQISTIRTVNTPEHQNQTSFNNSNVSYNITNSQISGQLEGAPVKESKNDFVDINNYHALNKIQLIYLLDRLSEKLIILYQYSFNASNNFKRDNRLYYEASKLYFKVKEKIFVSSYTIVAAIILPQEHNTNFIQKFIKRTIAIAHTKKWYYITEVVLQQRIKELIDWTKMRNQQMGSKMNEVPLLKWSIVNEPNKNVNVMPKDVVTLDNKVNNRLNCTKPKRKRKCRWRRAQKIRKIPKNQSELEKLLTGNNPAPNRRINIGSILESQKQITTSHFYSNNNNSTENKSSKGENPNASIECRELRLSRDSGIESPACSSEPSTETVPLLNDSGQSNSDLNCNPPADTTRPWATGPCMICHTITHKKCLGCYIHYYCSSKCQEINWPLHKKACRAARERRL